MQSHLMQILAHGNSEHVSGHGVIGYEKWIQWIGNFHPILLHFPIALIVMTVIAELLALKSKSTIFSQAARFMISMAAITAIPTAILGLAYGYGANYEDALQSIFWWHRFFGIGTAILAVFVAVLKELNIREKVAMKTYGFFLGILFLFVTITGYLGGEMTFGLFHLVP